MLHFPQRLFRLDMTFPHPHVQSSPFPTRFLTSPASPPLAAALSEHMLKCIRQKPSFRAWSSFSHPTTLHRGRPLSFVLRSVEMAISVGAARVAIRAVPPGDLLAFLAALFLGVPPSPFFDAGGCFPAFQRWHLPHRSDDSATLFPHVHVQLGVNPVEMRTWLWWPRQKPPSVETLGTLELAWEFLEHPAAMQRAAPLAFFLRSGDKAKGRPPSPAGTGRPGMAARSWAAPSGWASSAVGILGIGTL